MRTERELNIFQRNNRSREGENPASRTSFNHAGESHVHAVTKVRILPPALFVIQLKRPLTFSTKSIIEGRQSKVKKRR